MLNFVRGSEGWIACSRPDGTHVCDILYADSGKYVMFSPTPYIVAEEDLDEIKRYMTDLYEKADTTN